jgi:thiol-disulfide isomerase/thioredoxin
MRRALLLLIMVTGISLVVWAGWHNWRAGQNAKKALEANHVTLIPDTSASATPSDSSNAPSPLLGKPAPPLHLTDLNGKQVSLSDFKGHPLVVNFWGTYCAPCKIEMPWLETFSKKYAPDGFDVIGVTYDSEVGKEVISKNVQKLGVTYPILLSDAKVEKDYLSDTEVLPMSFYVDRAGKVIQVTAGLGSEDQLEAMVKQTIAAGAQ